MNDWSKVNLTGFSNSNSVEIVKQKYQYNYTHIPPLAMLDTVPEIEQFSKDWFYLVAQNMRIIFVNTIITNRGNRGSLSVRDEFELNG